MHATHGCPVARTLTGTCGIAYICCSAANAPESKVIMSTTRTRTRLDELFTVIRDAIAIAAAVSERHQPKARNLRGLGIHPEQFRNIRL
jgi:hypothetical protein